MRLKSTGMKAALKDVAYFQCNVAATMSEGTEVWRECMRWMKDVGVLDKSFVDTVTMMEFCAALRDGVILCRLVDLLIPGVIEGVALKPSSQFSCLKNITHFVDACRMHFSMRDDEVFEPIEMYNLSNFLKVLNVLSMMSYSEIALRHGLVPFPRRADSPGTHTPSRNSFSSSNGGDFCPSRIYRVISPTETEEAIYQALPDRVDEVNLDEKIYDTLHYHNTKDESEEKVYDVIVKKALSESEFDRADDPATARYLSFNPISKRDHVIKEILDTEQNYVEKGLNMISKRFHSPLTNVLKEDDHRVIFMNIAELWAFHSSFYTQLREAVFHTLGILERTDDRQRVNTVGDVFFKNKHKFTLYGPYCMGLDESRARILQLEKNDSNVRQRILECCASLNSQQFKLQDLLCLPMQRVLKYHLLLRELLKDTKPGHPEYHSLEKAREAMEDVNAYVNELKRDMEMKSTVDEIERSITDLQMPNEWRLIDYGREHKDGEVKLAELTSSSSAKFKPRYCFLFDKVLIVCKTNRSNTYTYKGAYIVTELRQERDAGSVVSNGNGTLNSALGGTIRKLAANHTLTFTRFLGANDRDSHHADTVKIIQMSFKNENQKQAWAEAFRIAKENSMPSVGSSQHTVHFITFKEKQGEEWPPCCAVCLNYLKGMFFQGYKCDRCNRAFHRECLSLDKCAGGTKRISQSASFSSVSSINSSIDPRRLISVQRGEQVAARSRVLPIDEAHLSFEKDDILEIIAVHGNMMATACHATNRSRMGMISLADVRKVQFRSNSTAGLGGLGGLNGAGGLSTAGVIIRKQSVTLPDRPAPSIISPMDDYVNTEVSAQEWFLGELTREESEHRLRGTPNGTYLVRFSPKKQQYVISISYAGEVKHTVIENPANATFWLDETTKFPSIVELINYYRENNLRESFTALDTKLTKPHRKCMTFKANHPYKATEPKFLELRVGDIITLLDTMGEERGWWKGRIGERVGFFPLSYVEPML